MTGEDLLSLTIAHLMELNSVVVTAFKLLSFVAVVMALTLAWKSETACSSESLTLSSDGYDKFIPKHNEALYRGYAALGLLLLSPACWLPVDRALVVVTGAAWFLLNEAIIELSEIRCHGSDQGAVGPAVFAAYAAVVLTTWAVYSGF